MDKIHKSPKITQFQAKFSQFVQNASWAFGQQVDSQDASPFTPVYNVPSGCPADHLYSDFFLRTFHCIDHLSHPSYFCERCYYSSSRRAASLLSFQKALWLPEVLHHSGYQTCCISLFLTGFLPKDREKERQRKCSSHIS